MKIIFLLSSLLALSPLLFSQNVGIGTNAPTEKLHINGNARIISLGGSGNAVILTNNTGVLDKVSLTGNATDIFDGTGTFVPFSSLSSSDWTLTGNTGTTAGTNFIGTTDGQDLQFKTNNITALTIGNVNQNIGIGTAVTTSRLSISQTAGVNASAISVSNSSASPAVIVNNLGTSDGTGLQVFITPVFQGNFATAIYGQSLDGNAGEGVAIWGVSGDYGVVGQSNGGNNFGVYSLGNSGASGTKAFHIDYPLDPENKTLSHYSIESNEILNVYRGIINLDANGNAQVNLPDYFNAVNTNPSYQLTAIGTPTQPYIATEIENNAFTVAGEPYSKVSWTVYAERNDPTVQYYVEQNNLKQNVKIKKEGEKGKYLTPQAYGKDESEGIFYKTESKLNFKE